MAEYIEREELINQIRLMVNRSSVGETSLNDISAKTICGLILEAPTANVVEVVRCKDCMWWYPREYGSVIGRCENPYNGLATEHIEEDEFCSCGKRKEGAEDE